MEADRNVKVVGEDMLFFRLGEAKWQHCPTRWMLVTSSGSSVFDTEMATFTFEEQRVIIRFLHLMTAVSASYDELFFWNNLGDLRTWTHHVHLKCVKMYAKCVSLGFFWNCFYLYILHTLIMCFFYIKARDIQLMLLASVYVSSSCVMTWV